jgi:hypothetical protein
VLIHLPTARVSQNRGDSRLARTCRFLAHDAWSAAAAAAAPTLQGLAHAPRLRPLRQRAVKAAVLDQGLELSPSIHLPVPIRIEH